MALQEIARFVFGLLVGPSLSTAAAQTSPAPLLVALLGRLYPLIWLRDQVKKRHRRSSARCPYNLDLLTLSVEAGLDFTAALAKVVEKGKPGPLNDELPSSSSS